MQRLQPLHHLSHAVRKRIVGGVHAGEQRIAADIRQLDRPQNRTQRRGRIEGDVGMPDIVVLATTSLVLGFDQHDVGIVGMCHQSAVGRVDGAEATSKAGEVVGRHVLAREKQHLVLEKSAVNRIGRTVIDRPQVHTSHFRADMAG